MACEHEKMKECLKHFSLRPPIGLVLKTLPQTIVGCRLDRAHEGVPKDTKWTIRYDRWLASPATSIQLRLQVTVKQRAGDRLAAYCTTFWCRSKHCTDRHHAMKFGNYRGTNILTSGGDAFKNFWGDFVFFVVLFLNCFTEQSPAKTISIPAASDGMQDWAKSKPQLLRGTCAYGIVRTTYCALFPHHRWLERVLHWNHLWAHTAHSWDNILAKFWCLKHVP